MYVPNIIWDICTLKKYESFFRNSYLTRHPVFLFDKPGSLTPGDIGQCLKTFGGVTTGIWWVGTRDAAKDSCSAQGNAHH